MTFHDLRDKIIEFREDRNWKQFHSVKDLLLGLNIEVSELQQLFLWKSKKEIEEIKLSSTDKIEDELSDILIFLVYLAEEFDIDLIDSANSKVDKNSKKYPIDKSYGSNKKYDELE